MSVYRLQKVKDADRTDKIEAKVKDPHSTDKKRRACRFYKGTSGCWN